MEPTKKITIDMPGKFYWTALEGAWPDENPRGATAMWNGASRKVGKGQRWTVIIEPDDAIDLCFHMESVADVWECMTGEERGSRSDPRVIRRAVENIRKVLT